MFVKADVKSVNEKNNRKIAFFDVVIDDAVVIHSVKLVVSEERKSMYMPKTSWLSKDGDLRKIDVVHPISSPARKIVEDAVIKAYEESLNFEEEF